MANFLVLSQNYHAWHDEFTSLTPPALGIPPHEHIKTLPDDYTEDLLSSADAVIIEPLVLDYSLQRREWLEQLRADCTKHNAVLIFDEIVTGFRVPQNFVYKTWGVKPDILCLGKALANGYPMAAVLMDKKYADPEWFCSGTYCGEMVGLAACSATLDLLATKKVDELFFYANRYMNNLNKILAEIDVHIKGYGTRGFLALNTLNEALFIQEACKAGYLYGKAFFYGYAHMEAGIDEIALQVAQDIVTKIRTGSVQLQGHMPQSSFKRY